MGLWLLALTTTGLIVWTGTTATPRLPDPARSGPADFAVPARVAVDPAGFPPGTCATLQPQPVRPRATVALDAGHGQRDPGATGLTSDGAPVVEKDVTMAVVDAAAQQLYRQGFAVVLTRSDTPGVVAPNDPLSPDALQDQLTIRARCANAVGATALVSVHANSFQDTSVRGAETVYEQHRALGADSQRLARLLQEGVLAGWGKVSGQAPADRGLLDDADGGESTGGHLVLLGPAIPGYIDEPTRMPSALIEPAFITNPADAEALRSPDGVGVLAAAITRAVTAYVESNGAS